MNGKYLMNKKEKHLLIMRQTLFTSENFAQKMTNQSVILLCNHKNTDSSQKIAKKFLTNNI